MAPLQGCYSPIDVLRGTADTVQQVRHYASFGGIPLTKLLEWTLQYLSAIALTWPSFYQLYPSLIGSAGFADPFRTTLYDPARYPPGYSPDAHWLTSAAATFQPLMSRAIPLPPAAVLTCVVATGLSTDEALVDPLAGVAWPQLRNPAVGDGVTTDVEQTAPQGLLVTVAGAHASVPLGITISGLLADLIRDPRVSAGTGAGSGGSAGSRAG